MQKFRFFLKKTCNFAFLRQFFGDFKLYWGENFLLTKGGGQKKFLLPWGVNRVSGRRGDSDFALQEEGNGTLPPPMPTCDGEDSKHTWAKRKIFTKGF